MRIVAAVAIAALSLAASARAADDHVRALKTVDAKFDFTPPVGAHVSTPLGD